MAMQCARVLAGREVRRLGTTHWNTTTHGLSAASIRCTSSTSTSAKEQPQEVLPFSAIPGDKELPIIGSIRPWTMRKFEGKAHAHIQHRFETFGPIYKEKVGSMRMVLVRDAEAIQKIHRQEPKFPRRFGFDHWIAWRKENEHDLGILTINE